MDPRSEATRASDPRAVISATAAWPGDFQQQGGRRAALARKAREVGVERRAVGRVGVEVARAQAPGEEVVAEERGRRDDLRERAGAPRGRERAELGLRFEVRGRLVGCPIIERSRRELFSPGGAPRPSARPTPAARPAARARAQAMQAQARLRPAAPQSAVATLRAWPRAAGPEAASRSSR
jgi:hypothetical protein